MTCEYGRGQPAGNADVGAGLSITLNCGRTMQRHSQSSPACRAAEAGRWRNAARSPPRRARESIHMLTGTTNSASLSSRRAACRRGAMPSRCRCLPSPRVTITSLQSSISTRSTCGREATGINRWHRAAAIRGEWRPCAQSQNRLERRVVMRVPHDLACETSMQFDKQEREDG